MRNPESEVRSRMRKKVPRGHTTAGLHYLIPGTLFFVLGAMAQFAIDWHTIDCGGGISTGDVYQVSGTIAQPDASGEMVGGSFALTGGYWAMFAVQTEGAPYLSIVVSGPFEATISWVPETPGWVLQETPSLEPAAWTNSPSLSTNPITVPVTQPTTFYRLHML